LLNSSSQKASEAQPPRLSHQNELDYNIDIDIHYYHNYVLQNPRNVISFPKEEKEKLLGMRAQIYHSQICRLRPTYMDFPLACVVLDTMMAGHEGLASTEPHPAPIQSTTPFVQPNPDWTVYSPPAPAWSTSIAEN
jgi:hypothetical protein